MGFRVKLLTAILIVVVQTVGPWLCCCVPARITAAITPRTAPSDSSACSHCKPIAKWSCEAKAKLGCCDPASPSKPKPSDCCEECCYSVKGHPAIVASPITLLTTTEPPGEYLMVAELGLASLGPHRFPEAARPPPFLSVESKLFTHHVLRC